jgi:ABC-2 type transport system ATP-binding protein
MKPGEAKNSNVILSIDGLGRRFGKRDVVKNLNLELAHGERAAFWGPNGSGKTTVLRCVGGTLTPTRGRISIAGHPAGTDEAQRLVGVSFSVERSFYLRLSGHSNLVFFARLRNLGRREAERHVQALEEELEIGEITAMRVDRCSTGMVQQLAFARALIGNPGVLILDEPTRSLDTDAVARLWAAVDRRPRAAVLIATHSRDDAGRCEKKIDLPS